MPKYQNKEAMHQLKKFDKGDPNLYDIQSLDINLGNLAFPIRIEDIATIENLNENLAIRVYELHKIDVFILI